MGKQFFWLSVRKNSGTRGKQLGNVEIPNSGNTKGNSWSWEWKKKGVKSPGSILALGS